MNNNAARPVTVFKIAQIFGEAYPKAAVLLNAINGLLKKAYITKTDYVAAATTEIESVGNSSVTKKKETTMGLNPERLLPMDLSPSQDFARPLPSPNPIS
ncbi:hypothetical protein JTB14_034579 [Gonioctena quinquepunctata]|nr:hypothetical protein JTB14_034579 [Gonioctena quinquepunctata]